MSWSIITKQIAEFADNCRSHAVDFVSSLLNSVLTALRLQADCAANIEVSWFMDWRRAAIAVSGAGMLLLGFGI